MGLWQSIQGIFSSRGKESASMQLSRQTGAGQGDIRVAKAALVDAVTATAMELQIVLKPGGIQVIEKAILEALDTGSVQNLQLFQRMRTSGMFMAPGMMQQQAPVIGPAEIAAIVGQVLDARGIGTSSALTQTNAPAKIDEV